MVLVLALLFAAVMAFVIIEQAERAGTVSTASEP
jgi:hypothetical protein